MEASAVQRRFRGRRIPLNQVAAALGGSKARLISLQHRLQPRTCWRNNGVCVHQAGLGALHRMTFLSKSGMLNNFFQHSNDGRERDMDPAFWAAVTEGYPVVLMVRDLLCSVLQN